MFFEDFLKDIHRNIIEEAKKKRKPHPSRLRGRGVEVSKTLFYEELVKQESVVRLGFMRCHFLNKNRRPGWRPCWVCGLCLKRCGSDSTT
ncbi:MAG: hypothetical protein IJH93_06960 [Lachnospiraceae bacterium]|nr:hypothetical protein [Lachnospiraceae bacterium]